MSADSAQVVFDAALSLPESLRSQLADRLLLSLAPPHMADESDWCQELRRRLDSLDRDELDTVSWDEGLAELKLRQERREST